MLYTPLPQRVVNFSAGPAALPLEVLQKIHQEFYSFGKSGMSIIEISHRSKPFLDIIEKCEEHLRILLGIPKNYSVLFAQGGATLQFSAIPLNLINTNKKAGYINTGIWSEKAIEEAKKYGAIEIIASSKKENYNVIPEIPSNEKIYDPLSYLHITVNNTIHGTKFPHIPSVPTPLVADMSSCILSENCDIEKFDLIYASAQKNIGPSGLTVIIIKNELLGHEQKNTPKLLSYQHISQNKSLANTPCTFAIYVSNLVLEWLIENGGVESFEQKNKKKAQLLYDFFDTSNLFKPKIKDASFRSIMNIPFFMETEKQEHIFLEEAEKNGFKNLKGHRTIGGMRASLYNSISLKEVEKFLDFIIEYEKNYLKQVK